MAALHNRSNSIDADSLPFIPDDDTLAEDTLQGAGALALFIYGEDTPQNRKKIYYDHDTGKRPIGKRGLLLYASKRVSREDHYNKARNQHSETLTKPAKPTTKKRVLPPEVMQPGAPEPGAITAPSPSQRPPQRAGETGQW